jgi:RNA polymerase sigma-70 factor, ECF subfamily
VGSLHNASDMQKHGTNNSPGIKPAPPQDFAELSDAELMTRIQGGDGDAFAFFFDRYRRLVLTVALRILQDSSEAQEVSQNVFLEIYRSARRFDPAKGTLKVWLLQFAYHRSISRRNYLLLRQFYNRPDLDEAAEASVNLAPRMPVPEMKRLVEQALGSLNESQRRVIQKVIFEGFGLREVAEQLGQSYGAVRNHYYRGLDRLRDCLAPLPGESREERATRFGEVRRGEA